MVDKIKDRYNNVAGGYYDEIGNSCTIKYRGSNNKILETDMESLQDTK